MKFGHEHAGKIRWEGESPDDFKKKRGIQKEEDGKEIKMKREGKSSGWSWTVVAVN